MVSKYVIQHTYQNQELHTLKHHISHSEGTMNTHTHTHTHTHTTRAAFAGDESQFVIEARDIIGNLRVVGDDPFRVEMEVRTIHVHARMACIRQKFRRCACVDSPVLCTWAPSTVVPLLLALTCRVSMCITSQVCVSTRLASSLHLGLACMLLSVAAHVHT
jgi:hypothetical protein